MSSKAGSAVGRRDVEQALERAERGGAAQRRTTLAKVEELLYQVDPAELVPALVNRAARLGVPRELIEGATSRPPHAVLAPLVTETGDTALIRTFYVSLDPAAGTQSSMRMEADAQRAIDASIVEARRLLRRPLDGRFRLVAARPESLRGASIRGASLSAAALVSAHSLWSGRSVLADVVVTGRVRGARVEGVGGVAAKVEAAVGVGAHAIVVPARDREEAERAAAGAIRVVSVSTITALLSHTLTVAGSAADVDDLVERALEAARHGWRGYRWAEARELLERALVLVPRGDMDRRVELYARFGAAERHLGALGRSAEILSRARAILARPGAGRLVAHETRSRAFQQISMTDLRLARFSSAAANADRAVREARRAASVREVIKALGCVGLVARARGAFGDAVRAFEEALRLGLVVAPDDAARSRAYLVEALAATGDLARGAREYRLALHEAEREGAASKEAWVRTAWGGALVSASRHTRARAVLDVPAVHDAIARAPLPGLLARRHLGRALIRRNETLADGLALLLGSESSDSAQAAGLLLAEVNVWIALAEKARRGLLEPGDLERIDSSSRGFTHDEHLTRFLGPAVERVRRERARATGAALGAALEALVARAERLA